MPPGLAISYRVLAFYFEGFRGSDPESSPPAFTFNHPNGFRKRAFNVLRPPGASRHCHRNVRQGRSAPVFGRSNAREQATVETPPHTWQTELSHPLGRCALHASFTQSRGDDSPESSVRSAMFIATLAAPSAKLRRSGMDSCIRVRSRIDRGLWAAMSSLCAAPTELDRAPGLAVTINMALLTELARPL